MQKRERSFLDFKQAQWATKRESSTLLFESIAHYCNALEKGTEQALRVCFIEYAFSVPHLVKENCWITSQLMRLWRSLSTASPEEKRGCSAAVSFHRRNHCIVLRQALLEVCTGHLHSRIGAGGPVPSKAHHHLIVVR